MKVHHVLFLCTGNYYRSRYAEEIFNYRAAIEGLNWRAFSRGAAEKGSSGNIGPISRFAAEALAAKKISAEGAARYPLSCSKIDLDNADHVVALKEAEHRPLIERRFPNIVNAIEYWNVDDIEFMDPSTALTMIDELVNGLIVRLGKAAG